MNETDRFCINTRQYRDITQNEIACVSGYLVGDAHQCNRGLLCSVVDVSRCQTHRNGPRQPPYGAQSTACSNTIIIKVANMRCVKDGFPQDEYDAWLVQSYLPDGRAAGHPTCQKQEQ